MDDRRRFLNLVALALAIALGLGACARTGPPAPVVQGHGEATAVVVQRGDTVYAIARRSSVPVRALIDANRLQPPYHLQIGQSLVLPRIRTHTVQAGETLSGIARRNNVSTSAMVAANGIEPPFVIKVGQILTLPDTIAAEAPTAPVIAAAPVAPAPIEPQAVEARPSEVQQAALPPPPAARPPAPTMRPGTPEPPSVAERPELSPPGSVPVPPPAAPAAPPVPAAAPSPVLTPPVAAVPAAPPPPAPPAPEPPEARGTVPDPPPRAGRLFLWPVKGSVISDFGSKPGGLQNDGINIAAPEGTVIRAAENGVVVYSGNELRGFGNLLLIRHSGGWMTTYAHASELLVKRAQEVKRGQPIAKVGASGNVNSPQLHFEIRRGTRAVNPREYLADDGFRTAARN